MSTGGTGGHPIEGLNYGATSAQHSVDFADDPDPKGTAAGYVPDQNQGKSILGSLKEALKPGDTRRQQQQQQGQGQGHGPGYKGDFTHDGRHGGVEETMTRGHRDYDEAQEGPQSHRDGMRAGGALESAMPGRKTHRDRERGVGGGILNAVKAAGSSMPSAPAALKKAVGGGGSDPGRTMGGDSGPRNAGGTDRGSRFDKFPATGNYLGPEPGESDDAATRVSALDSQGSVGHQFSSEGAIGGNVQKLGGPFSKEGVVGRHFTDKGAVGGTVQDTMGHGDATRKGV